MGKKTPNEAAILSTVSTIVCPKTNSGDCNALVNVTGKKSLYVIVPSKRRESDDDFSIAVCRRTMAWLAYSSVITTGSSLLLVLLVEYQTADMIVIQIQNGYFN